MKLKPSTYTSHRLTVELKLLMSWMGASLYAHQIILYLIAYYFHRITNAANWVSKQLGKFSILEPVFLYSKLLYRLLFMHWKTRQRTTDTNGCCGNKFAHSLTHNMDKEDTKTFEG